MPPHGRVNESCDMPCSVHGPSSLKLMYVSSTFYMYSFRSLDCVICVDNDYSKQIRRLFVCFRRQPLIVTVTSREYLARASMSVFLESGFQIIDGKGRENEKIGKTYYWGVRQ